jgi:hypothetical protein
VVLWAERTVAMARESTVVPICWQERERGEERERERERDRERERESER